MQVLRGAPLDVTFDGLSGSRLDDTFTNMPSLTVLRRSVHELITDAKDPRVGEEQPSSKCTGIRALIRRPREQIRQAHQAHQSRTHNKLHKREGSRSLGWLRQDKSEEVEHAAGREGGKGALGTGTGSGSGAGAVGTGEGQGQGQGTSTGTTETTKNAERPRLNTTATTTLHALFSAVTVDFLYFPCWPSRLLLVRTGGNKLVPGIVPGTTICLGFLDIARAESLYLSAYTIRYTLPISLDPRNEAFGLF
ncbi:hypothetical protein GGR52DRAFT_408987 [Hypoxylon sp. FL1284]|nr:hypothetical protein GGR52DRAFT_408987 [Hypoxylon sp. FL1284]